MIRTAVVSLFATCTMKCGYCSLAESGQVLDHRQLEQFKDQSFIERTADFFNSRTTEGDKWQLLFTGGEPLIAPNLDVLCRKLFDAGNTVAFYTSLHVGPKHVGWKLLLGSSYPEVDYVMASFHPEAEQWEDTFFDQVRALKECGHNVFVRIVGHPKRLSRFDELSDKCRKLDVCFFPTALLTDNYPRAYTEAESSALKRHFSSLTQFIQLEGGIDTTNTACYAGSKIIGVDLQSGNVTPCITVASPVIGNVHKNELSLTLQTVGCPQAGVNCVCDIHYEQDIVIGAEDNKYFIQQKEGFVVPLAKPDPLAAMRAAGIRFYVNPKTGMGRNTNEELLVFSRDQVKARYRRNILGLVEPSPAATTIDDLAEPTKSVLNKLKESMHRILRRDK